MSSMMRVIGLVIFCLALSVRGQMSAMSEGDVTGFFQCGRYECIDQPGVTCDRRTRKCHCPPDNEGDARIACANPDKVCQCIVWGDPHIFTFLGYETRLYLACTHTLANLTTKTRAFPDGCQLNAIGVADFDRANAHPQLAVERQVDIKVSAGHTTFTARIIKGETLQSQLTSTDGPPEFVVRYWQAYGFTYIGIDKCDIELKFKDNHGFFSLQTSVDETHNVGLCGECRRRFAGVNHHNDIGHTRWLEILLHSLTNESPIDGSDINYYEFCSAITDQFKGCTPGRREYARRVCGTMFTNTKVRDCLTGQGGFSIVDQAFLDCFTEVCKPVVRPCIFYENLFRTCPIRWPLPIRTDPNFCTPGTVEVE